MSKNEQIYHSQYSLKQKLENKKKINILKKKFVVRNKKTRRIKRHVKSEITLDHIVSSTIIKII